MHRTNVMALKLMPYKVSAYGISDIGLVRQNNEDSWRQLSDEHFYVLADGMGGHNAGEVASWKCVDTLCQLFKERFNRSKNLVESKKIIYTLIQDVNTIIYQLGHQFVKLRGMGTTVCCLLVHPDGMIYGHVGDSRIYRLREGRLEQLTSDHSLLRELIDLGQLSEQQAEEFSYKNIVTKAIGSECVVEPSVRSIPIMPGDIFLMCTDGLSDLLSSHEIESILSKTPSESALEELIKSAKQKGGFDNITVVMVKIEENDESLIS